MVYNSDTYIATLIINNIPAKESKLKKKCFLKYAVENTFKAS